MMEIHAFIARQAFRRDANEEPHHYSRHRFAYRMLKHGHGRKRKFRIKSTARQAAGRYVSLLDKLRRRRRAVFYGKGDLRRELTREFKRLDP
jgi:hypothetical protein